MVNQSPHPWYRMQIADIFSRLSTSRYGLSGAEAEARRLRYGPNVIETEEPVKPLAILIRQIQDPLIYVLIVAALITVLLRDYTDAIAISAVIVINSLVGFVQEYKAERAMRALAELVSPRAKVVRDGQEVDEDSRDLVPGDVVVLESGARVPADLRVFHAVELQVDESLLTGESLPVRKQIAPIDEERLALGDQANVAFMGTSITRGRGHGVVVATGKDTELGRIGAAVRSVGETVTPLQERLHDFSRLIGIIVLGLAILTFALGIILQQPIVDMFLIAVSMAVAAIPEGLPVVVTVALAVSVNRMARRNAIVRKLPVVETLGSTTVIGSDKTGTLTRNEMTVRKILANGHVYEVGGTGYSPKGEISLDGEGLAPAMPAPLLLTLRIGLLCNESDVYQSQSRYRVQGDPTEGALIVAAAKAGLERAIEEDNFPQIDLLPFESDRQYMATLHNHGDERWLMVKGAPERVLAMCDRSYGDKGMMPLDQAAVQDTQHRLADEGLRVLAMAFKLLPPHIKNMPEADVERGLVFAGLQAMIDPPREEAIDAVARSKRAGIRVVMITGDHVTTARAIAARMGIGDGREAALTGHDIEAMSDDELYRQVPRVGLYARVSPEHKLRIVQQLKRQGNTVAVTGDGVNDAAALKAAHIGIAMGVAGTDVAREASDMVLADDNFASIVAAIEEGRVAYDNIRKAVFFLIPTGIGFVVALLVSMILGLPIPFLPAQILWVNLVTNGLQDVALAFEPKEDDILQRSPRPRDEGIFNRLMIERSVLVGMVLVGASLGIFIWQLSTGAPLDYARSAAITTVVMVQLYHVLNSRSFTRSILQMAPFSNRFLFVSLVLGLGAHILALHMPLLQFVLHLQPIAPGDWLVIAVIAFLVVVVVEIDKLIRRRSRASVPGQVEE